MIGCSSLICFAIGFLFGYGLSNGQAFVGVAGGCLALGGLKLFNVADDRFESFRKGIREKRRPCPHGIRGGQTRGRCPICQEERAKEIQEEMKRIKSKLEIGKAAYELKQGELDRLRKLRLRRFDQLLSLSAKEFEQAIAAMYSRMGYSVHLTPHVDGGKDVVMTKARKKYLVECKRYDRRRMVGRPELQKFFAALVEESAQGGFFVTTGGFSKTAQKYAIDQKIELVKGEDLVNLMREAFPDVGGDTSYKVMCKECGDIVNLDFEQGIHDGHCRNGHAVKIDFGKEELSPRCLSRSKRR
jgi:HJR/Mrr/RecB family endonuclease